MTVSTSQTDGTDPTVAEIAINIGNGAIMRELGLDPETLRLGLIIANQHLQRGAVDEAFQTYSTLLICNPTDPDFHIGLADCALRLGILDIALKSASAAIGLAGRDPRGYLLSAQALMQLKQTEAAIADARDAIRLADATTPGSDLIEHVRASAERIVATLSNGAAA